MNNLVDSDINTQGGAVVSGNVTAQTFVGRDQINIFVFNAEQIRMALAEYDLSEQVIEQYHEITKYVLVGILGARVFNIALIDYLQLEVEKVPPVWRTNAESYASQFNELARCLRTARIPAHAKGIKPITIDAALQFETASRILKDAADQNVLLQTVQGMSHLQAAVDLLQKIAGIIVRAIDPTVAEADGGHLAIKLFDKIDFSSLKLTESKV